MSEPQGTDTLGLVQETGTYVGEPESTGSPFPLAGDRGGATSGISSEADYTEEMPDSSPSISGALESYAVPESVLTTTAAIRNSTVRDIDHIGPTNITGDNIETTIYQDSEKPYFAKLDPEDIARRARVFAKPKGYEEFKNARRSRGDRVLILHGPEHAGKLTCAVKLACDLFEGKGRPEIWLYQREAEDSLPLAEVVARDDVGDYSCIVLRDAFSKNVPMEELDAAAIQSLNATLKEKHAFLIITTVLKAVDLLLLGVESLNAQPELLREVLENHLEELTEEDIEKSPSDEELSWDERVRLAWGRLLPLLPKPGQVQRFCERAAEKQPRDESALLELAREISLSGRKELGRWFNSLTSHEKLLSMLCYLLGGERSVVLKTFVWALHTLRKEEMTWLADPCSIGLEDGLEAIRAGGGGGVIEFEERAIEEEVRRQLGNWRPLTQAVIGRLVEELTASDGRQDLTTGRAVGVALGKMASHDWAWFERIADKLSLDSNKGVPIAASALGEMPRVGDMALTWRAATKLRDWLKDHKQHWAAANAIWRLYQAVSTVAPADSGETEKLLEHLEATLRRLGQRTNRSDNVVHAVQRMSTVQPARMTRLTAGWLSEGEDKLREVAKGGVRAVFESLSSARVKPRFRKYATLLDLLGPVVTAIAPEAKAVEQLFVNLKQWIEIEDWEEPIVSNLLTLANYGNSEARRRLRTSLTRWWLNGTPGKARHIAQAIITRCDAMDGTLADSPTLGRGLLVVDPLLLFGATQQREIFRDILAMLQAQLQVTLLYLGTLEPAKNAEEAEVANPPAYPVPRLLMPVVERLGWGELAVVVVLASADILDLEDVMARSWSKRLFVIAPPSSATLFEGINRTDFSPSGLRAFQEALRGHWSRVLATAPPRDWYHLLQGFDVDLHRLDVAPKSCLEDWVMQLDSSEEATSPRDLALRILCSLGWFASFDFQSCIELLRDWLTAEGEVGKRRRAMGLAGARTLFDMHRARRVGGNHVVPELLFETLAWPMAAASLDGAKAVLEAVQEWVMDPDLAAFFAGGCEEGRGRLLRWAEQFVPEHFEELKAALPGILGAKGVAEEVREAFSALLDRLTLRRILGQQQVLPELLEGERYGLILIDSGEPDNRLRGRLSGLVSQVHNGLCELGLRSVVYRIGQRTPAWTEKVPPPPGLFSAKGAELPRLIGALLSRPELAPERVGLAVVLTARPLLDLDDWVDSPWRHRITFFRADGETWTAPSFISLPETRLSEPNAIVGLLRRSLREELSQ